jgi:methyl-accepting chemotaxis protein
MMSASIDLVVNGFEFVHDADNTLHSIAETVMAINKKSVAISTAASQQMPTLESKAAPIYS